MAEIKKAEGFIDWLDQRLAIKLLGRVLLSEYWIPKNINFLWAMGVVLVVLFALLMVSGIFLLMYYKPDINLAYDSVNYARGRIRLAVEASSRSQCFGHIFSDLYSPFHGDLLWLIQKRA